MQRSDDVKQALAWLKGRSSAEVRDGMARFAIPSDKALGVRMPDIRALGKKLGPDQQLAEALWETDVYEARILASFVGDARVLTGACMDLWCDGFDSWAVCDAMCFNLFDRAGPRWEKVEEWAGCEGEFQKRAAYALIWGMSVHDRKAADTPFLRSLELMEREAHDGRNFVKKAVNMALRGVGKRNAALHAAALETAERMAVSNEPAARWNGKDALRELRSAPVQARLERKKR